MNKELFEVSVETVESVPSIAQGGKDELNLAEFPIALLSEKSPVGVRTLQYQDQIFDSGRKRLVKRRLVIEGSETYGLPTAKDDEVILALVQLSKRNGFQSRNIEFSRFELLSMLGWANTGQSYARIQLSLHRWVSVTLHYENAWWDKAEERWTSGAFHIIDDFEINDSREQSKQLTLLASRINWNERVFKSFLEGNLKTLRYDIYVNLNHATSKRMYRFLDKRFYNTKTLEFGLKDFAYEHIGLSRSYKDCGKIKEKLEKALEELEQIGFLEPMTRDERYEKVGKGSWRIKLIRKSDKVLASADAPPLPSAPGTTLPSGLVVELTERGVSLSTAEELLSAFTPEYIAGKIEILDWLIARKDKRANKSPGGYLADSIRRKYATPKDFESKAQLAAKKEAQENAARIAAQAKREQEEQAALRKAKDKADDLAIDAYLARLTDSEVNKIELEVKSKLDLGHGPHPFMKMFVRSHVAQLLGLAGAERS